MSDQAPRWPGSAGGPGLDFSSWGHSVKTPPSPTDPDESGEAADAATQEQSGFTSGSSPQGAPDFSQAEESGNSTHAGSDSAEQADVKTVGIDELESVERSTDELDFEDGEPSKGIGASIAGAASSAAARAKEAVANFRSGLTRPPSEDPASASAPRRIGARRTRKARLRLARIDPWSVMKTSFLFAFSFGVILIVMSWVLWGVFASSGAIGALNESLTTLIGDQEGSAVDVGQWLNGPRIVGFTALVAAIDVVILTAVSTLFAFLYNLAASLIGGLEITLAED